MENYQGSCHCGQIVFTVKTDTEFSTRCDCSMCRRRGAIILRCKQDNLKTLSGEEHLQMYQFGANKAEHYFCKQCGIHVFYRLKKLPEQFGVNSGCLDGIDQNTLSPVLTKGSKT